MSASSNPRVLASALTGAAFLMATSAIGPGFITQTTVFTNSLRTSFGFVILCSIVIDIVVQLNIWRVVAVSGLRMQDLADRTIKRSGYVLTFLIVLGGLAFNIGNIAGAGLGLQVMTNVDINVGAMISMAIALFIFWNKEAGKTMDMFARILGLLMVCLTACIAISSRPPLAAALLHAFVPETIDTTAIIILVGGTVGGYISFAGIHRLLDAGVTGEKNLRAVSGSSMKAILLAALMRILLYLAALGIVSSGGVLDPANPAASVFEIAAGNIGYRIFGIVLWAASITSVVGSAYTSVSFLKTFHPAFEKHYQLVIASFILISGGTFLMIGRPVNVLIIVGALNAFVLPLAMMIILIASGKKQLLGAYEHPLWLKSAGWIIVAVLWAMVLKTLLGDLGKLWA
jgi:Mn2+/Fe2+ NRAMP family transporter